MIPGEVRVSAEPLELSSGREQRTLVIVNDGDRPIQVGSHIHLPDTNPALSFDRDQAQGFRLDVPAGTSIRFEPGVSRTVDLIALGGTATVPGLQIRELDGERPTHAREPKQVVPFGTPGTPVDSPSRAGGVGVRLSDEPPHPEPGAANDQDEETS
ncbi:MULTISPECIES: urease subunit beta [unclassified Nocardioides]|uniref:urease subunit beta n=1 Tax=unclassified Nocardioides TaxID=2615069 RepID=UPI0006FA514B|nr:MULTISPECIES: urease subunit beta [unclassified Nocardioides]KQY56890.1 urease [Nocardioides sp. Root140]KRF13012.1 urease [Nocardioides sp. Soil796]